MGGHSGEIFLNPPSIAEKWLDTVENFLNPPSIFSISARRLIGSMTVESWKNDMGGSSM